jgi:hypothetical protein
MWKANCVQWNVDGLLIVLGAGFVYRSERDRFAFAARARPASTLAQGLANPPLRGFSPPACVFKEAGWCRSPFAWRTS